MKKPRVISLFSGAGGMDLGFKQASCEIIWANDIFKEAIQTYKNNIGNHIVDADIRTISNDDIPNNADIIIGGFPCQGFSIANKNRSTNDDRNFLYQEMLRIISNKLPKFFVAENVKGILSLDNGKVFEKIKFDFESIGYHVDAKILNSAEYGVPQARERVIIIGNRLKKENPYPIKTHYISQPTLFDINDNLSKAITTEEAIGYLSDVRISYNPIVLDNEIVYNHIASTNVADKFWGRKYNVNQADICDYLVYWRNKSGWSTKKVDEHFGYKYTAGHWFRKDNNSGSIPSADDWWELKKILGFDDKYDEQVTTYIEKDIKFEQSLRVTNWDRPSDTITATSPEIHINRKRRLSVRECAILQTFPNDFVFTGNLHRMYAQVGNAVPVKLANKIAQRIVEIL